MDSLVPWTERRRRDACSGLRTPVGPVHFSRSAAASLKRSSWSNGSRGPSSVGNSRSWHPYKTGVSFQPLLTPSAAEPRVIVQSPSGLASAETPGRRACGQVGTLSAGASGPLGWQTGLEPLVSLHSSSRALLSPAVPCPRRLADMHLNHEVSAWGRGSRWACTGQVCPPAWEPAACLQQWEEQRNPRAV